MRAALPYVDRFLAGARSGEPGGARPASSPASRGGTRREGDPARRRALARTRREGGGRDGRRDAALGAAAGRREARGLRERRDGGSVSGGCVESDVYEQRARCSRAAKPKLLTLRDRGRARVSGSACPAAARSTSSSSAPRAAASSGCSSSSTRERARCPLHRRRGRAARREAARRSRRGETSATGPPSWPRSRRRAPAQGRNTQLELDDGAGLRRGLRPAAAAARLRRGRHGRGALRAAKLLGWHTIVADARGQVRARASGSRARTS